MSYIKYILVFLLLNISTVWAADTAKIDYDAILDSNETVAAYKNETQALQIKVLNQYNDLEDLREEAINDELDQKARDSITLELAKQQSQIAEQWYVGLATINMKYDEKIIALDEKIAKAITELMTEKNLKYIQDGPLQQGQKKADMVDITQNIIDKITEK
ncbi:MAG: hypothetical protein CMN56_10290 [Sneathiella sp.]|mgnify:CR=1 FL=1|uniref:hypothetical protein n=1 Tax=Sneathiella sp. TaxID=1964365 RepID=UPI000C519444|nr:hypothetical protein [Sneathiella sp.]MAZ03517.1 hypothetical protein [Sneathiella sp.]